MTQEQALLLAVEAARHEQSAESDGILRAVQDRRGATERILPVGDGKVTTLDWWNAPGTERIVAGGADRSVVLFDGATGAQLSRISLPHGVEELRFSPSGDRVLAHSGDWQGWAVLGTMHDQLTVLASGEAEAAILRVAWREDGASALILDEHGINVLNQNNEIETISLPHLRIADGQLLPGGAEVLVCGQDANEKTGYAAVYARGAAEPSWEIEAGGDPIQRCAVSADGRWFATSTGDGTLLFDRDAPPDADPRDLEGGEVSVFAFNHATDSAGVYLAAGMSSGAVAIWHVTQEENKCLMNGHEAGVSSLSWSADDRQLLSSSADRTSILWDTELGTKNALLSGHDQPVTEAVMDPRDDSRVASSSEDGTVRIFKVGLPYPRVFGWVEQDIMDAALDPAGAAVALVRRSGVVQILPSSPGELHLGAAERPLATVSVPGARIATARFCGDAHTLVVRDEARKVRLLSLTGATLSEMQGAVSPDTRPTCSADGRYIAAYDATGAIVWLRETGARIGSVDTDPQAGAQIRGVAWNPTQDAIALWGGEGISKVRLVGPGVAKNSDRLGGITGEVHAIGWSHDGTRLAIADDGPAGGKTPRILIYDGVLSGATAAPSQVLTLDAFSKTTDLAWSPDDAHLVSVNASLGQIWDTRDWSRGRELLARELRQVVWSPAPAGEGLEERVATVDAHGVLRLFEPGTGALAAQINVPESTVRRVSFTPDGAFMLALLSDDTARILPVYQDALIPQLCGRAVRNFTAEEWLRFVVDEPYRQTCENLPAAPLEEGGD